MDVTNFLISHSCSLNEMNVLGDTPLHKAVWRNQKETVKLLLEAGADTTILNKESQVKEEKVHYLSNRASKSIFLFDSTATN